MGNVPAKEGRNRSYSYTGNSPHVADATGLITRHAQPGSRRNTLPHSYGTSSVLEFRKSKRKEEKDRNRETHYLGLIVRLDENVDGGYLAPYGTYKSNLDYNTEIVRKLIINRQLAPFFTPLQDFNADWTDEELLILLSQLSLHSIETAYDDEQEEDDIDNHKIHKSSNYYKRQEDKAELRALIERVKQLQKDEEARFLEQKLQVKENGFATELSQEIPSKELLLRLYRNASECPICFLYYPRNLNVSRCCFQPICTECFVQIKRLDPHSPHDDPSNQNGSDSLPHTLISESASCPYCASPDFGVTYEAPHDIKTGLGGNTKPGNYVRKQSEAEVSKTRVSEPVEDNIMMKKPIKSGKRRSSMAADAPGVITTDTIRPDWEQKLNSARNKLARKAATASAIHASNLLISNGEAEDQYKEASGTRRQGSGINSHLRTVEDRMIEEAMRLSILDEQERRNKSDNNSK